MWASRSAHILKTHTLHTGCAGLPVFLSFPCSGFHFRLRTGEASALLWGKGKQRLSEEKEKGAPVLEKRLSGSGGQPKGRILVLESHRGEEGWNHVSFILPSSLLLCCPDWERINSFNPVFLWIRLAFWATAAALFANHSPRGAGKRRRGGGRSGGELAVRQEVVNDNILERSTEPNNDINKSVREGTGGQDKVKKNGEKSKILSLS